MNENNFINNQAEKKTSAKKAEKHRLRLEKSPEEKLAMLLQNNSLSREVLIEEAENKICDVSVLGLSVIYECGLQDKYIEFRKNNEGYTEEESIFSFLEKKQQKLEQAKVEQEPQMVDVPAVSVEPIISPKEEAEEQERIKKEIQELEEKLAQAPKIPEPKPEPIKISQQPKAPDNLPIAPIKTAESFPQPERKNWWEVKRETEVMAIEDLDGDMSLFEKHVKELNVAKKNTKGNWQWTGKDKKLVFLGDILGDRQMDGVEITNTIFDLADQAEKQKGQVNFLCGNHDIFFINFLCKVSGSISNDHIDVWELAKFDPDSKSELRKIEPLIKSGPHKGFVDKKFIQQGKEIWKKLYDKMPEILANMRNDAKGKEFLKNICRIKVAEVYDDTLFCHTDPTTAIVADLTKSGNIAQRVLEINKIFQKNLWEVLFNGGKFNDEFRQIEKKYLNVSNRAYFVEINSDLTQDLYIRFRQEMNRITVEEKIEEWKRENELIGNYIDDVMEILDEYKSKTKNQNRIYELQDKLIEKIKELNSGEKYIEKTRDSGINAIIHGHSPSPGRFYDENDLVIVSPHATFKSFHIRESGISTIRKNGKIDLIGKSFREKKPV